MRNTLIKTIKKYPKFRKFLVKCKDYFYKYVKNGYYKNMLGYFCFEYNKELEALEKYGFKNCKIYNTHFWRRHDGIDDVSRRFYCADFGEKKVFIKVSRNDTTMQNEIEISKYLRGFAVDFIAKPEMYKINFNNGFDMLAIEFLKGLKSYHLPKTAEEFSKHCVQISRILDGLENAKIIHADIHRNNLMLDANNELKIVDFGISFSKNARNSVNYLARPGTFFITKDEHIRIYDDAYSFVKMIESFNPSDEFLKLKEFVDISNRVGQFTFEVDINKFVNT